MLPQGSFGRLDASLESWRKELGRRLIIGDIHARYGKLLAHLMGLAIDTGAGSGTGPLTIADMDSKTFWQV